MSDLGSDSGKAALELEAKLAEAILKFLEKVFFNVSGTIKNIIVKQSFTLEKDNKQYARGTNQDLHFRQRRFHLFCGFANSFRMINDRKLRYACCENFMLGYPFNKAMSLFLNHNGLDINNIFDLFCAFSIKQNLIFLLLIMLHILQNILRIDISSERIYIVILKKIKIRINLIRRYKNA